jgi:oligopeptide transport system ATP-binding protein
MRAVRNPLVNAPSAKPILSVRRLRVEYPAARDWPWSSAATIHAVDDVHFNLHPGEALGILGDAGCGKSTLARALVGLQPIEGGGIVLDDRDLARLDAPGWRPVRRDLQLVFQDASASLDPRLTVADSVAEPLETLCSELDVDARAARIQQMLERLGLPLAIAPKRPHELTASECQRVALARALVVQPRVLVCDEPVSALEPHERRRVLDVLDELRRETRLATVLVTRDPSLVREECHRVLVMYLGRVMEQGSSEELFAQPRHPYTRALVTGAPIEGEAPDPAHPPGGCVFRTRCPMADELCAREVPYLRRVGESGHAACHYVQGALDEAPLAEGIVGKPRRAVIGDGPQLS